eukprot:14391012-Alexandrium_andersonii.AAC.1
MREHRLECRPAFAAAGSDELGHFFECHEFDRIMCDNFPSSQQPSRDRTVQAKLLLDPTDFSTAALACVAVGAHGYPVQKIKALTDFIGVVRRAVRHFHV